MSKDLELLKQLNDVVLTTILNGFLHNNTILKIEDISMVYHLRNMLFEYRMRRNNDHSIDFNIPEKAKLALKNLQDTYLTQFKKFELDVTFDEKKLYSEKYQGELLKKIETQYPLVAKFIPSSQFFYKLANSPHSIDITNADTQNTIKNILTGLLYSPYSSFSITDLKRWEDADGIYYLEKDYSYERITISHIKKVLEITPNTEIQDLVNKWDANYPNVKPLINNIKTPEQNDHKDEVVGLIKQAQKSAADRIAATYLTTILPLDERNKYRKGVNEILSIIKEENAKPGANFESVMTPVIANIQDIVNYNFKTTISNDDTVFFIAQIFNYVIFYLGHSPVVEEGKGAFSKLLECLHKAGVIKDEGMLKKYQKSYEALYTSERYQAHRKQYKLNTKDGLIYDFMQLIEPPYLAALKAFAPDMKWWINVFFAPLKCQWRKNGSDYYDALKLPLRQEFKATEIHIYTKISTGLQTNFFDKYIVNEPWTVDDVRRQSAFYSTFRCDVDEKTLETSLAKWKAEDDEKWKIKNKQ